MNADGDDSFANATVSETGQDELSDVLATDPGDAFEDACWGLLRRKYSQTDIVYLPAAMGGDCGIEGFSVDGIAYQCYADRDSVNLRHRTDKQKKKLYTDTVKLKKYEKKLEAILDGLVIQHYFLMVPQYHAVELVTYATDRSKAVRDYNLSFIANDFAIRIKTPDDYPAELRAALTDGAAKALIPDLTIGEEDVSLFPDSKPKLVKVLDDKLSTLRAATPNVNLALLRDRLIRAFLAKEQVMEALTEWPETFESVERRRRLRQESLELESELSAEAPNNRLLALITEYERDLIANASGVRELDARRIAMGQICDWLMRCPLSFRAVS